MARGFVRALFLSILVLVTIALFSQFLFPVHVRRLLYGDVDPDIPYGYNAIGYNRHCSRLNHASVTLPLNATTLFIVAPRRRSVGHLSAYSSADNPSSDSLKVDISHHSSKLTCPVFCLLSNPYNDTHGIALLTRNPFRWPWRPRPPPVAFNIDLVFPKSNSTIHVKDFSTTLPNFSQSFSDLDSIHFEWFYVQSTKRYISAQSINADSAFISTTNVPISGTFNAFSGLVLRTSNAPIDANVNVCRPDPSRSFRSFRRPHVSLTTSNAPINATISLYTKADKELNQDRDISLSVNTTNGVLTLSVPEIPVNSRVHIFASTSKNPAYVSLHPAYEGPFKVRTLDAPARLEINHDVKDLAGLGRKRGIIQHQCRLGKRNAADDDDHDNDYDNDDDDEHDLSCSGNGDEGRNFSVVAASMDQNPLLSQIPSRNVLSGNVFWSEAGKYRGGIDIKTSHAPAILSL